METVLLTHYWRNLILNKWIIIGLVAVFSAILLQRECSHAADKKAQEESYEAVITFKDGERNQMKKSLDLAIADREVMQQNVMSNKVALEQLGKELEGYKKVNAYLKSEVTTKLTNLEAKYEDLDRDPFDGITLQDGKYIHMDDVNKNFLRVPKQFSYEDDEWIQFYGTVKREKTVMDSLKVFNKFDATIGYMKPDTMKWKWLKKPVPVVELKSYNPYTKINYVNNVVVDNDKGKVGNILLSKPAMFLYGFVAGRAF